MSFYEVDSTISKSANADKYHYLANRAPIKVTAKRGAADSKMVLTYTYIEQDSKKKLQSLVLQIKMESMYIRQQQELKRMKQSIQHGSTRTR